MYNWLYQLKGSPDEKNHDNKASCTNAYMMVARQNIR
ncbi:Uncharacterised protein [Providencia rettgeri]|uniref:Uncharacterized protein n=1 Tax=Providencia rettgeri TaxID=587 RepID=A0A379FTV6_PRORE|nr:Uncharacterised protein [Providencia rettgeri]